MSADSSSEKIILGLDPGTSVMGYGLIKVKKQKVNLLQFGVIHLSKYTGHELKLKKIFDVIYDRVGLCKAVPTCTKCDKLYTFNFAVNKHIRNKYKLS